ncbi:TorF family putative porin [Aquimarina sp. M1]
MNSTQLTQLYTDLQKQVNDQDQLIFVSAAEAVKIPETASAYKRFVPDEKLRIDGVVITMPDADAILINGTTGSFGISNSGCTVTFFIKNGILYSTMNILIIDETLALPGVDWFSIGKPFYNVTVPEAKLPLVGWVGGTVETGVPIKLQMGYPIVNDIWLFQGSFSEPLPNISNFYQLIGGVNLATSLPQPFSTLTSLSLKTIDVSYNSVTSSMDYMSVSIGTPSDYTWQLLPDLAVTNIEIKSLVSGFNSSIASNVSFTITGNFTIGPEGSNNVAVIANVPNFKVSVQLLDGTIQLGDLLTMFWSDVTIDLSSEITIFNLLVDPTSKNYSLNCSVKSDWTFLSISDPKLDFTMTGMSLEIASQQGTASGKFAGLFNIGADESTNNPGVDITLFAGYADKTWTFGGNTGKDQKISLVDIAFTFLKPFGIGSIPTWVSNDGVVLDISNVSFLATVPDKSTNKPTSYQVGGTVNWQLNFSSFNLDLTAITDVTFTNGKAAGKITSATTLLGLTFDIGYQFGDKEDEIYLQWEGIKASYTKKDNQDIFAVTFKEMSLGDIITKFMEAIIPSFELSAPWSLLNSISLDGLSFTYTRNLSDSTKNTIVISYDNAVDLGFLNISKIKLTKDNQGVHLGFEGTFLGLTITAGDETTGALAGKGSKVQDMPSVPGLGSQFFDLKFLGMGQHLELANSASFNSVDEAITAMESAFDDPNSSPNTIPIKAGTTGPLVFNQNSDWLIGADFTVAQFYRMAFVFNDPNLYGLVIGVSEKAEFLKNLQFEILYKKINDTIGVYQIELQLPDVFRQLEFGAVSITLPNIGVKIYTNGNFYLDIGWPESITNFSRSFTLQMFPFIGSGGFYFASLTGATATDLPAVQKGVFNPVIEAGVAISVGLGKTINKGILKAGLSLTAIGIFQGTYASFTPNPNLPNGLSNETDTYYRFAGTLALVGKIYGEVNFAIISASFDITAYIQVTFIIEAYRAIPVTFEAGVSVSLSVKINLGLFKITIHLSFSTTITASFVIGSDTTQNSLWYKVDHTDQLFAKKALFLASTAPTILKWQPIEIDTEETFGLDLYFVPHLTVSGETLTNITPGPQYVGMLYIDTGTTNPGSFTQFGMNALATGALYWAANAIVGSSQSSTKLSWLKEQTITTDELHQMLCYIETRPNNAAPFNYKNTSGNDIETFLKAFFTVQISAVDASKDTDMSAAVFPIFPELQMQTVLNGVDGDLIDFATQSMTGTQRYLEDVTKLLKSLSVAYESAATASHYAPSDCENVSDPDYEEQPDLSMPTFIFTDFIALVVKQLLQNALDYLNAQGETSMKVSDMITEVITTENVGQLNGMASRFMLHGLRLPEPPTVDSGVTEPLYVLTGQQWTVSDKIKTTDTYQVNLLNSGAAWINFIKPIDGKLEVIIDSDAIQRTINLRTNVLDPSIISGYPKAITNFKDTPQNFSLGGNTEWNYPGDFFNGIVTKPTLWKTPSNFRAELQQNSKVLDFSLKTLTPDGDTTKQGTIDNLKWATSLNVNVQRVTAQDLLDTPLAGNIYNLVGADDASINILEDILTYMNKNQGGSDSFIEQIQFLMKPDPATGKSGFVSSENGALNAAIIQANLSTETNPGGTVAFAKMVSETPQYNTLNDPGDFATLLWECSIVRSGGFYFYYITPEDAKGLPDYLFSESGVASIQMVITYANFIPQPFVNGVITGDDLDFSKTAVYAQSPDVTVLVPTLMPGNVGYELSRNNPGDFDPTQNPPTTPEDQVYLQNQFNLLGVSLPTITVYQNYMPAGPTDPMSQEDIQNAKAGNAPASDPSGPWNYNSAIPYYKFVQGANDDPDYPNPYAGIGTDVAMSLNWQDMFGNTPTTEVNPLSVSMKSLYTDTILSVSQWPSVSSFYLFEEKTGIPELFISFCFDVSRYNDGTSGALNNATVDLVTYMNLFYQLGSGDMVMNFTSTIQGTKETPEGFRKDIDIAALSSAFIQPVINYLKAIVGGDSSPDASAIPIPYTISGAIASDSIADYNDSIPLLVHINMNRTKNIDPNFEEALGVANATTGVKPQAQSFACGTEPNSALGLSYFAGLFETAFTNQPAEGILIKIATASDVEENTDASDPSGPIWMVRFDSKGVKGIKYTYDNSKAYFFSPIPLATSLVSLNTKINQYQTGKPYPSGTAVTQNFSGIDLDDWGKQFLEAFDSFLAPGLAVPAFLLDNGKILEDILDSKEDLAEAIEGTIDYIIDVADKSAANIGNAQEKWKQEILKELSATYKYSAAIQTPVTINSSWDESNADPVDGTSTTPKLYGNMVGDEPTVPDEGSTIQPSTEYSLSTSKLPMGNGDSWLTYMFESKDTSEFRNFQFGNMQYKVSHLEQQIHAIDGIDGYTASTWLTFIIPLDADLSDVGQIIIPIPLRAYPTPPSVTAQGINYPTVEEVKTLQDARTWDFIYTYKNAIAAQDTIETQIELNIPGDDMMSAKMAKATSVTLDIALAQFIEVYPQINDDFKSYLANLTQKDVTEKSTIYTNALYAVEAFKTIVSQVAEAWKSWNQVNPRKPQAMLKSEAFAAVQESILLNFTVIETGAKNSGNLNVRVIPNSQNPMDQIPMINIPGYTATNIGNNTYDYYKTNNDGVKIYLSYGDRNIQPLREVVLNDLDILNTQNAWGGAQIIRNMDLLPNNSDSWQPTNKHFLYQTPLVRFYTKLITLLSDKTTIDIAAIATKEYPVSANRSLADNMLALFDSFTTGVDAASLHMKLSVDYTYLIPNTEFPVTVPVLLTTPFDLATTDNGTSFANSLASSMNDWLKANIISTPNGTFTFEIDVFSSLDANTLIFQLPLSLAM